MGVLHGAHEVADMSIDVSQDHSQPLGGHGLALNERGLRD
jgi:hypothetical protein